MRRQHRMPFAGRSWNMQRSAPIDVECDAVAAHLGAMRDLFAEIFASEPLDPTEAARRAMRPQLRRRFYRRVDIDANDGAFCILLDGRLVKTPARRLLAAPTQALAQALAEEWREQRDVIDPGKMPLTRLANPIIDGLSSGPVAVATDIEKYLASDLVL